MTKELNKTTTSLFTDITRLARNKAQNQRSARRQNTEASPAARGARRRPSLQPMSSSDDSIPDERSRRNSRWQGSAKAALDDSASMKQQMADEAEAKGLSVPTEVYDGQVFFNHVSTNADDDAAPEKPSWQAMRGLKGVMRLGQAGREQVGQTIENGIGENLGKLLGTSRRTSAMTCGRRPSMDSLRRVEPRVEPSSTSARSDAPAPPPADEGYSRTIVHAGHRVSFTATPASGPARTRTPSPAASSPAQARTPSPADADDDNKAPRLPLASAPPTASVPEQRAEACGAVDADTMTPVIPLT
eukprot:389078-Prymnesium_polylepis.1